jgi:hypothetical protein
MIRTKDSFDAGKVCDEDTCGSCVRFLLAGASACTACVAGTYSNSTGAGHD